KPKPKGTGTARTAKSGKKTARTKATTRAKSKPASPPPTAQPAGDYAAYRDRQADISRARSTKGREIGPLPGIADPQRKTRCRASLLEFCRTYFPKRFKLAFSTSHRTAIERMEACTDAGRLFACAMPRGAGKTTIAECAAPFEFSAGFGAQPGA